LVQALHLWRRPTAFLEECARRYGDVFTLRLPAMPPEVHFSHPDAIREIFTTHEDGLAAGEANAIIEPLVGRHSLLRLDGARHLRERRLMLPSFHGERMQAYGAVMRTMADRAIDAWPIGRPIALREEMMQVTLDVILRTVFGLDEDQAGARLREGVVRLLALAANPTWLMPWMQWDLGRWSPWGRYVRLRSEVHTLLLDEIRRRQTDGAPGNDILSLLLAARDERGEPMRDEEVRDEMVTLLFAGHETTATALAWTVGCILEHPPVLRALREELEGAGDDVSRLPYLDATIKEGLRLHPIIPDVGRLLTRPMRLGGWDLPAGVIAAPSIYLTHRRPERWPDPERFAPERFIATRPTPYEFLPFGGGSRRCVGMAFAMYEMKIVLARILRRVALRPLAGYRVRPERRSVTLAPSRGFPVVIERRLA
jgi:cytochrome P450